MCCHYVLYTRLMGCEWVMRTHTLSAIKKKITSYVEWCITLSSYFYKYNFISTFYSIIKTCVLSTFNFAFCQLIQQMVQMIHNKHYFEFDASVFRKNYNKHVFIALFWNPLNLPYLRFHIKSALCYNVMNVINNNNLKKITYKTVYFPQKTVSRYKHFLSLRLSSQA